MTALLQLLAEALVALLILAGSFFLLVGSLGLARLPTLIQRLHAPTKAATDKVMSAWWSTLGLPTRRDQERSLHKLDQLRQSGGITQDEYEKMKADLLK